MKRLMIALFFGMVVVWPISNVVLANHPPGPPGTVTICHKPGTSDEKTLEVPHKAWEKGHRRHGDVLGQCAALAYTQWTTKASMPTGRFDVAAAATNGKVFAIGGESLGFITHADVEEYDPVTDSWAIRARLSIERTAVAVTVGADGKIYAIGGNLDGGITGFRSVTTLEVYDPGSDSWTIKTPMTVRRSYLVAATASNGKIYAMGGIQTNNQLPVATVEEYNPITDTWTTKNEDADCPV